MFSFSKQDPSEWPEYYIEAGIELVNLKIIKDSAIITKNDNNNDILIKLYLYDLKWFIEEFGYI